MNTLIITAQPSSKGFVHVLAAQYEGTKKAQKQEVEIVNLYDEKYALPFLNFEDMQTMEKKYLSETQKLLQEKMTNADDIVFVFPLWWGSMPAILKNFFDSVFTSGFAFEFENGRPNALLKGKTAKVIVTHDSPKWLYWFLGFPLKKLLKKMILGFCGIKTTDFLTFGKISFADEKTKNKIVEKITRLAL